MFWGSYNELPAVHRENRNCNAVCYQSGIAVQAAANHICLVLLKKVTYVCYMEPKLLSLHCNFTHLHPVRLCSSGSMPCQLARFPFRAPCGLCIVCAMY